ncbi:hypothetical protein [Halobaculum lipolyticum]|uniref:Uncharacterized protein n=1 Tax=Halobaculum lipolyticum TaxID=3032001 RepID=A0ABD5WGG6_9EURY|nr:hypothetical protein [Halobaculum sp. DT31]
MVADVSDRTDRLLALHVVLLALLTISQTTTVPRNQLLGTIGLLVGALAAAYAVAELVRAS